MASNLTSIGIATDSDDALRTLLVELATASVERLATDAGDYAIWRSRTGAEVWFHLEGQREAGGALVEPAIVGLTPFFGGEAETVVRLTEVVRRDGDTPFEGAFYTWVAPESGSDVEGLYPLLIDAVDFAAHAERVLPIVVRIQPVGFARSLRAFESEDDYIAAQDGRDDGGARLAPLAVIPVGLFTKELAADNDNEGAARASLAEAQATALLTGRVVAYERQENEATGASFDHITVASYGLKLDVVADPTVVEGAIVEGGTVEVMCQIFARILD